MPYPETTDVYITSSATYYSTRRNRRTAGDMGESFTGTYNHGGSRLGCSVSLSRDGSTLAVGAEGESFADSTNFLTSTQTYAGAVYVYELSNSSWSLTNNGATPNFNEKYSISPPNYTLYGHYGHSVKIFKDQWGIKTLVVGELEWMIHNHNQDLHQ